MVTKKLLGVGLIFGAATAVGGFSESAHAATIVSAGTVSTINGPGGLDLFGQFPYAINFTADTATPVGNLTVNGVNFLHDRQVIPGATLTGPQNVVNWQTKPEFGGTADDNNLETIMKDIRWANTGNTGANEFLQADLVVSPGADYKLQVLFYGNHAETRTWDIYSEGALVVDRITSLGLEGASYASNATVVYTLAFTATDSVYSIRFDGHNIPAGGQANIGDINPIWQALTLEQVIPEPASLSLIGLAGLGLLRRRSRVAD